MSEKACFSYNVYKLAKHGFATTNLSRLSMRLKHTDIPLKKKFWVTVVSKEGHTGSLLEHERTHYN